MYGYHTSSLRRPPSLCDMHAALTLRTVAQNPLLNPPSVGLICVKLLQSGYGDVFDDGRGGDDEKRLLTSAEIRRKKMRREVKVLGG